MSRITRTPPLVESQLPPFAPATKEPMPPGRTGAILAWSRHAVPTLLVLAALASLGIWGHHTGWTMPKFSALIGNGPDQADDWCKEHGVPESVCVVCKPALFPKPTNYGWCATHGVHNCPFEHPDVAQLSTTPKITEAELARAQRALKLSDRPTNGPTCKLHESLIQFASKEAFEKLGIGLAVAWPSAITEAITANGAELTYDQERIARLSSRAAGTVWRVDEHVGDDVREGQVLALIDSAEVGRARTAYVQAMAKVDLKSKALANLQATEGAAQGRRINETEAELREARVDLLNAQQALANLGLPLSAEELAEVRPEKVAERVRFLGMPADVRRTLKPETVAGTLLPLRAPLGGRIVRTGAGHDSGAVVAGEVIDTNRVLFTVVDTRRLWLMLDVRVEEAKLVQIGQQVAFRPDGHKKDLFGKVTWIDTAVDERTRTIKVRGELANPPEDQPDVRLHAHMWGIGRIILREEKDALVVPDDAIHDEGCCWVVFVQDKDFAKKDRPKIFHVRKVRLGAKAKGHTEIIAGVLKGEMVAARNSGVLRSQLLKNNLGAG